MNNLVPENHHIEETLWSGGHTLPTTQQSFIVSVQGLGTIRLYQID